MLSDLYLPFKSLLMLYVEQARPLLLEKHAIHELVDPCLRDCYSEQEVYNMVQCAWCCIQRDPHLRPRMSQVRELGF